MKDQEAVELGLTVRAMPNRRIDHSGKSKNFRKVLSHLKAGLGGSAALRYLRSEGIEASVAVRELRRSGLDELGF